MRKTTTTVLDPPSAPQATTTAVPRKDRPVSNPISHAIDSDFPPPWSGALQVVAGMSLINGLSGLVARPEMRGWLG